MTVLATAAQMRELDRVAIEERGIPSLELMEEAAQAAAEELWRRMRKNGCAVGAGSIGIIGGRTPVTEEEQKQLRDMRTIVESKNEETGPRVAVFCGPGNNGGDGVAAARILKTMGCSVRAFLVGKREHMTPDCKANEERLKAVGGQLEDFDFEDRLLRVWVSTCDGIMDALFGVGLNREVGGDFCTAIEMINRCRHSRCPVVSCDIPSGLNADTGKVMGAAVKADETVTFSHAKIGLYLDQGRAYSGEVYVAPIGIPHDLSRTMIRQHSRTEVIPEYAQLTLPRRPRTAHKGDFGKVFILAGSEGYTGAPVLAANAAVRVGAGLVFLGVPREVYPIVAVKCDETMPFPLMEEYDKILDKARSCDVALIGPGLGRAPGTGELVRRLLADLDRPVVLDADGINALSGHIDILDRRTAPTVLTPHDGEFQRLTGCVLPLEDRLGAARDFAAAHRCVLVLKGHTTITAGPDGRAILNATGNPGMARGGSGDVLAGMLAGFWGQKHLDGPRADLTERTAAVVWYHGKVGDTCAQRLGEYAMTPTDMIEVLPEVLRSQEEQES